MKVQMNEYQNIEVVKQRSKCNANHQASSSSVSK